MIDSVPDISGELGCLIVYLMFLGICFAFYKIGVRQKGGWFGLSIAVYLICIWFYFEAVNQLEEYLANNKILYIEFGHANLELILLALFCLLNAFILIGVTTYRRRKRLAKS